MEKTKLFVGVFLLVFVADAAVKATKLNYPRVLLPIFNKISVNFTLEVIEKGCSKWTSSRQDLILITPLYEDTEAECSYRAIVSVLTRERRRNTAIVLAEDITTGESLRCDVILDVIDKLGVHTTTRQLYLEEAPETFELRAEDSEGNAFTTLEGIEFNWSIVSLNSNSKGWSAALRFLTFTESAYHEVPASLEKFEAANIKGYMVLLEGINTGTATVTVSLPYPEYSHVNTIEVMIHVMANIILEPSEIYILPGDTINFRIFQLKMGKMQEISLSNQYFLELEDQNVAKLSGVSATGLQQGLTVVVLRDRNVPNDDSFIANNIASIPSARLTVTEAVKLGLSLLPHNNWMTVVGEHNEIALDLYNSEDQKITLGSRFGMQAELDELVFYIMKRNKNNTRLYGEALKEGVTTVYGRFKELTAQAELQIFSKLSLSPSKVILPFDPNIVKSQRIQFTATGGDGSYVWRTPNTRVLQISQQGLATTVIRDVIEAKRQDVYESGSVLTAHASVKVALNKNQKISRSAIIYFLPPVKLEIVKYNFETALHDYVRLHVAVYTFANDTYIPITHCENMHFDFEFSNQIFQLDNNEVTSNTAQNACQVVHLRSTALGLTHLQLFYKFQDKILRDEVTLSVFEKMQVLNPVDNVIVLPIGASRNIIYLNGPRRIYTMESELTKSTFFDKKVAEVNQIDLESKNNIYALNVLCQKLGSTSLDFNVFNALSSSNFEAYVSTARTEIHCVKPRFLNLYATEQLRSSCPMEVKNALLHLKERDDKFEIEIEVQDVHNRKLMNISSLHIDWNFSTELGPVTIAHSQHTEEEIIEGIRLPSKDFLLASITDEQQNLRIKGLVSRYNANVLKRHYIKAEAPPFAIINPKTGQSVTPIIENEIHFMAVNSTLFANDHINIFMSNKRVERIPIAHGSGFYEYQIQQTDIISVEFDAKERMLIVTPLRMGNTVIEVIDRCLMAEPARLYISVVSIGAIRIYAPDRVEQKKSIEAIVKMYDSNENLLNIDPFNIQIYDLSENVWNADILTIKLGDQSGLDLGEIRYIITGNNLGETKIVVNAGIGDKMVSSQPANVQVFPPLRLYPRNSTLVVGSSVQIHYLGGPQPDVNIVYHVHDKKVISMDSAIVVARKLGKTLITGKCIMTNPGNNTEVVISEDTVEVHVVPLINIQIRTPLIRIRSGAVMPADIWGLPDLSPMILGTLENMRVTWSSNQPDVVEIYSVFTDVGIEYGCADLISVRIKALNPGKAKVKAIVDFPGDQQLTAEVEVVVFKILELESPKHITKDWILVPPRSSIQLKANIDEVIYKPATDSSGIVKVSSDGIVRTQETLGRDLILAKSLEQTLPIGIEVKNVHYILASLEYPTSKLKKVEEKIPRGMNFALKVSLHDNLGNEFSHNIEDVNYIKYDVATKNIIDVQIGNNMTIALNLPRETNNMLLISLRDATGVKFAEDYIKLAVGESKHIYPAKHTFSVGDVICFDSPLSTYSIWTTSDEHIISINKYTGVGKVLSSRNKLGEKVVVTNGDKATGFIKYDVEVRDADVIQMLKSTDIFSGNTHRGYLILRNHFQTDKLTNLIAKNVTKCLSALQKIPVNEFTCQLMSTQKLGQQLIEHYKVTPIFDADKGLYACQIDLISTFTKVFSIVKMNDVQMELKATLCSGLSDSTILKFIPGIQVKPEALFVNDLKEDVVVITGLDKILQKVEVKASDPKMLTVTQKSKIHGLMQYEVKIVSERLADEQLFVSVESPLTEQHFQIPIQATNTMLDECRASPLSALLYKIASHVGIIVTAFVLLIATFWVYIFFFSPRPLINDAALRKPDRCIPGQTTYSPGTSNSIYPRTPCTPVYASPVNTPIFSPNLTSSSASPGYSSRNETPVYGNTTLLSPNRRLNRSFL